MKKLLCGILCLVMVFALASCVDKGNNPPAGGTNDNGNNNTNNPPVDETPDNGGDTETTIMTYEEYIAAAVNDPVTVEVYVQATQSWWADKITVYAADIDGAYFIYEMACSEEDAAKLTLGTKIRVSGFKAEWSGEIEIVDATFEFVEGETYDAGVVELTDMLGDETIIDYQNQHVRFRGLTVEAIEYKNGTPGDDIYLTLSYNGANYNFCVERYLTGPESNVYKNVMALEVGDVIDVTGFLYWYEGMNPHITGIKYSGAMSYAEYCEAAINDLVVVEAYVQATQSWWSNKITVYAADQDGAYFIYEMACSEEDAAKLVPGAKILITGTKGEWAGEIEIMNATFKFVEDDPFVAEAKDLTSVLGTEELINYQNQLAIFKGLTVEEITYKNGAPGDDIYVKLGYNGSTYSFCVERYLTGPETEVYQAVMALQVGDVVDVTGYLYWYENVNTHITNVIVK